MEGIAAAHPDAPRFATKCVSATGLSKRCWISGEETESFRQRLDEFPLG